VDLETPPVDSRLDLLDVTSAETIPGLLDALDRCPAFFVAGGLMEMCLRSFPFLSRDDQQLLPSLG